MPLVSGSKLGPYEIVSPLGAGGMGEVYRARDTRLERTLVIKILAAILAATQPITGIFHVTVRNNRLNGNGDYGIAVVAGGFPYRSNPRQLTGTFEGTFEHNALIDNGRNASLLGFTSRQASLGELPRQDFKYMQKSTFQVADLDGELEGFDYDHPLNDPFDDSPVVGNVLLVNGVVQPNGIRITPRP